MRIYRVNAKPIKMFLARRMRKYPTEAEKILWQHIRAKQLGLHFHRQKIILGFIADFYCPQIGLVIEVDGGYHLAAKDYDEQRENAMKSIGLQIIRFTNEEVINNLANVLARISAYHPSSTSWENTACGEQ